MHDISNLGCRKSDGLQLFIMCKYFFRCIIKSFYSVIHNDDPLHVFRNIFHAVGYQNNGNSSCLMETCNLIKDLIPPHRIQSCGRLIQDQYLGIHRQNTGNGYSSLLSSGQFKRGLRIITFVQSHMFQGFFCPFFTFLRWQILILRSETDVGQYIGLKQLMFRILEDQSYLTSQSTKRKFVCPDILSLKINMSFCRTDQSIKMLDQGGFSTSGVSDDSNKLSLRYFQIDIF